MENEQNLQNSVKAIADSFDYEPDRLRIFDSWQVLRSVNGRYRGDCEDFALTVFWHLSNKNVLRFLWNLLISHRYSMYRVRDSNGESHVVACFQDQWFDNWTRKTLSRDDFFKSTQHELLHIYPGPFIALYLLIGLFSN